ncbi:hypothetical protein GGR58DRAFT_507794 [Xylaria digitata]|nr:hypothetical protein GGR58DRAFT_507794 [Xylaria digitata]
MDTNISVSLGPQCVAERALPPALSPPAPLQTPSSSPGECKRITVPSLLNPSPAHRTPLLPIPPRPAGKKTKTEHEKRRGESLHLGGKGVQATRPCQRCTRLKKTCWVARSPSEFNSFKCGRCIGGKIQCSLSHSNPGIDYEPEVLESNLKREVGKKAAREKASNTREVKQNARILMLMTTRKTSDSAKASEDPTTSESPPSSASSPCTP